MATLVLAAIGSSVGGGLFGSVGAVVGQAVGAIAGSFIDGAIVNALTPPVSRQGPRLTTANFQTSTEGANIERLHGRARISGNIIWATRFEEEITVERSGGKGLGGPKVETTTYSYFGNFAIGLAEGPIAGIGRIWADGAEIDQTDFEFRVYLGDEEQEADPLIEAREGEGNAPAYRGLAYIVFERMPLEGFGRRLPQIAVEVYRPVGELERLVRGVCVIGGNEFGFDTDLVREVAETGGAGQNRHTLIATTDWAASIDRLQMLCPNLEAVTLVAPWFGDDLRCGSCTIRPKVDSATKATSPHLWSVAGLTRATADTVSLHDGTPAFGGSPSDASLIRAIQDLHERGLKVTLLPFLMMDVPFGNDLPNPYSDDAGETGQAPYPWRGRITGSPAPGFDGTADKTGAAAAQVSAFVGSAEAADFSGAGVAVTYSGPAEWSYRRFILHYAQLAALAGGVETFLIGSEMIGLTQLRSDASTYPFVSALIDIADEVRTLLGAGVAISYAADWSEYHSHRPVDGSGDVFFNLDPLWSDARIDFIGIDNYMPLADWRDGTQHVDFNPAGATTIYDDGYLRSNVEGGEYYDWYYDNQAARDTQSRTPITDGLSGKPWVFRQKDIRNWWQNLHHDRPGGGEAGTPTGWIAESKPVRFIEMGCPAVDKGANQPNVFVDPKSSESEWPYYSSRARDDAMQRAWLGALTGWWSDHNPVSAGYAGPMVDLENSSVWCWDVRPWPSFPFDANWGDAANWEQGHWLSGRLGAAPARETITALLDDAQFDDYLIEPIPMVVDGVTTGSLSTARSVLDALRAPYQFDAIESDGVIKFAARLGRASVATISGDDLAVAGDNPSRFKLTRAQETELPDAIKIGYGDPVRDDQPASVEARRSSGGSLRIIEFATPVIMAENFAAGIAERELQSAWVGRERAEFALPPSRLALDPGDVVDFLPAGRQMRLSDIADAETRQVEAFAVDPTMLAPVQLPRSSGRSLKPRLFLDADVIFMDGPLLRDRDSDHAAYAAGLMLPFGSGIACYRESGAAFAFDSLLTVPMTAGVLEHDFYSGPAWRWDRVNTLYVRLYRGDFSSADELAVLNGANPLAVENADGEWEVLQFASAAALGERVFALTNLLRGQRGSEHAMRDPVSAGARVLLLNAAVSQTNLPRDLVGLPLQWRCGPAGRAVADDGFIEQTVTLKAKARRPLSPVHLAALWEDDGDIQLSWTRRTRIDGDNWEQGEVPLGEALETYEVEILDGGTIVRTVTGLGAPAWLYRLDDQTTDFGGAALSISFKVYQMSARFGRGIAGEYP